MDTGLRLSTNMASRLMTMTKDAKGSARRQKQNQTESIAVPEVTVHSKLIANHNVLSVAVGTNCPQGGDTGHGGRTLFRLKNYGSTDIRIKVDGKDLACARRIAI